MKTATFFLIIALSVTSFQFAVAQHNTVVSEQIVAALAKGDAVTLAMHFDKKVMLSVDKHNGLFEHTEAQRIVADFFAQNVVSGFTAQHQGGSEQSSFIIGTIRTAEDTFRVTVYFRGKNAVILQFRIEKEQK